MEPLGNDAWMAAFTVGEPARYEYTVEGWIDRFGTWRQELTKKVEAGQDLSSELLEVASLVLSVAERANAEPDREALQRTARVLADGERAQKERVAAALLPELVALTSRHVDRSDATRYDRVLEVIVERERARFGAWYEMFPRSAGTDPGRSATFDEAAALLPYVAS